MRLKGEGYGGLLIAELMYLGVNVPDCISNEKCLISLSIKLFRKLFILNFVSYMRGCHVDRVST